MTTPRQSTIWPRLVSCLVALSLGLSLTITVSAVKPTTVQATDCGAVLVKASDWLNSNGVDVHSNGADMNTGTGCANNDTEAYNLSANPPIYGFGWQCVELVNRLYTTKGWYSKLTIPGTYKDQSTNYGAKWLYTLAADSYYSGLAAHANGSGYTPVPGDMIIHSNGTYGHVAVVSSVSDTSISGVDENRSATGWESYTWDPKTHTATLSGATISGFIHADKNTSMNNSGDSSPPPTPSRPAALSRDPGSMDVFYRRSSDHAVVNVGWNSSTGWGSPHGVGSDASSNPSATSRTSDSMDVFYRDSKCWLWVVSWTAAGSWGTPVALVKDGSVQGDPTVIHRTPDSLEVFYKNTSNNLANIGWTAQYGWSGPWTIVGNGGVDGSPVAITRSSDQMSIFYRDNNHNLLEEGWTSTNGWSGPWPHVTGSAAGDFSVVSRTPNSLDLVYLTIGGGVGKIGWNATYGWNGQVLVPSGTVGNPTIVARGTGNMDVFWADSQGHLIDDGWDVNRGWNGPATLTTNVGDNPAGLSRSSGSMDIFFRNKGPDHVGDLTSAGWDVTYGWHAGLPGANDMD